MDYNILIADFAGKNRICMTDTLYQYDYGQKLKIESIPALPQTFEAHFSNVQHGGVSITVTGMDGIVDIPNSLLMTGKRIYCWIYVTEPGSGETEYQVLIPVQARPMPEYYDVTDVGVFDSVVHQVGDYAATATAGATNATASATAAATSASEAAASVSAAETAKNAAETAQGNAEDAQTAAETAAQTATEKAQQTAQDAAQAALDAGRAESAAGRAEAAQTGAENAKADAETAAQGAAASASAASASASSAGQAATSAGQSATAAAGSATTAENAAQTATTKAGEASASATAANTAKTAAQTAQTGAETAATNAGQSASTATAKAAEAAQSATDAAASKTAAEAAATRAETAAASLTVDSALSNSSVNPVQNKVITEAITDVKSTINELGVNDNVYVQPEWEQGDINISNYTLDYSSTSPYTCRMVEGSPAIFMNGTIIRVKDPVYRFSYYYSGTSGKWYGQSSQTEFTVNVNSGNYRMTFSVRRTDWHVMTPEEAANAIEIILPFNPYNMRNEEYYKLFSLSDALTISGIFLTTGNGMNDASTSGKVSSFIPVSNGQTIKYDLSSAGYVICLYDTGFKFVSGVESTSAGTLVITADGYIRICCSNDYAGYVYFDYPTSDKVQVEFDKINHIITDDVTGTDYMQTALARITGELKEKSVLGNIVTIGFSTDQHIKDDGDVTATLPVLRGLTVLSRLTQAYPYDFVCLGGDACEAGAYATTIERILDECVTVQKPLHDAWCPVVPITGNHDAAQNNANITGGMLFNAHFKRIANSGFLEGWDSTHTNGYWDSAAHKIRFIFFDDTTRTDYTSTQRSNALTAMLTNIPEGYNIVIFSHHPLSTALTDSKWQNPIAMQSILDAYATRIICCICGHSHIDISETSGGILYIATTLAQYAHDQAGQRGTLNTETETAFDTFVIDQTNKHIYAIRYGHGENRDWTYTLA